MSVPYTREAYQGWSAPGAPDVTDWPMTANVRAFLGQARMGATKSADATVVAFPVAGQVKGGDGPDWQVPCVLLDVRATNRGGEQKRILYGYCERMQWQAGRWVIAPGAPAAAAPATWPGTALSADAGWRPWVLTGEPHD